MYSKIQNIHKLYNLQIYKSHWVNVTFTKKNTYAMENTWFKP